MKKRLGGFLSAVLFAAAVYGAWLYAGEKAKVADVTLALLRQPREEVLVSGYVNNLGASAFSLEALLLEEPGRAPYRRQVALDSERRFELALGRPRPGVYRVSLWTRRTALLGGTKEGWLRAPDLVVDEGATRTKQVRARQYDERSVAWFVAAVTLAGAALGFLIRRAQRPPSPLAPG